MDKTLLQSIFSQYGLSPNKRLGQNFLVSSAVADRIIRSIGPDTNDRILEIGPGLGALTARLLETAQSVTAVEIDSGLVRYLRDSLGQRKNFRLVHGDFLKFNDDDGYTKVASNMPYYCSSEILFKLTAFRAGFIYVMIQRELADRIMARPGQKSYGALSVNLCFYFRPALEFHVSRDSFFPRPDVGSTFMRLERIENMALTAEGRDLFHRIVRSAFWGRRKTILKSLSESPHLSMDRQHAGEILDLAGIERRARGEDLSLDDFARLAAILDEQKKREGGG